MAVEWRLQSAPIRVIVDREYRPIMNYISFSFHKIVVLFMPWILFGANYTMADVLIGFEKSSGYEANTTIIGVTDTTIPGIKPWVGTFGSSSFNALLEISTANPQTGAQALRLTNNATGTAIGASLQLTSNVDVKKPFNIHFSLALSQISEGTVNQAQVYFGAKGSQIGTFPYWFGIVYSNGSLSLALNSSDNSTAAFYIELGNYTDYANLGSYITFDIAIDPSTNKFTSVKLSGALKSADLTKYVLSSASGGTIPHLNSIPDTFFSLASGGNDMVIADLDNVYITGISPSSIH